MTEKEGAKYTQLRMKKFQPMMIGRMDSCISGDPNEELASALQADNLRLFVDLLNSDEVDVNAEIGPENRSTILHLAVQAEKAEFVREIVKRRDLNPNIPHKILKKFPLHVAAENGDSESLKLLSLSGADLNAKMENGSTALHQICVRSACKWAKLDGEELIAKRRGFADCAGFLLSRPGINVDHANAIGVTPLYFAVTKGAEEVAELLLKSGASVLTEIDGETVEELLESKMPNLYSRVNLDGNRTNRDTTENQLFHVLYSEYVDSGAFERSWIEAESNNNGKINPNADNGTYTFMQYACDQGLDAVVAFLMSKGADVNKYCVNYRMPPVTIAGHHGYYKIIKLFKEFSVKNPKFAVNFAAVDGIKRENVLHKLLKAESKAYVNLEHRHYDKCLSLLLDDSGLSMQKLIQGAIDAQDQLGNTPLHNAAECGRENAVRKLLRCGANIGIKNQYDITPIDKIKPEIMEEFLDECLQSDGLPIDNDFKLTFKYAFLGPPLRRDWKRDQLMMNEEDDEDGDETDEEEDKRGVNLPEAEPLWYLSQSPNHRSLLTHPVISSFLCLKWRRIRPYYYINLAFYTVFLVLLTSYLLIRTTNETPYQLKWTTFAFLVLITIRELFQAMVSFRRYIFNVENLLEISMIVMLFCLFFTPSQREATPTDRLLGGYSLLLCWIEMVLLLGRHPKLSTYTTMFVTVSMNFFWFLSVFALFIIAFGLAFFLVLEQPPGANHYYATPSRALFKTVVMSLTGELEFEGIDFAFGGLISVILFLLYVFFILLVLVNLLNGLAVSDIAEIQKHAEIVSHVSRVELISYTESMLLGDPFQFLTNWPAVSWLRKLPSCSCLKAFYAVKPVRKFLEMLMGDTLLFQSRLKYKKAIFAPNRSRYEDSLPGPETDNLILDKNIITTATDLVVRRANENQVVDISGLEAKLESLEKTVKLLAKQNNHLIELCNK